MGSKARQATLTARPALVANRLHSAAIHLLRRLRTEDAAAGLSPSRLSALSVVVFGGPVTLGDLAAAEQVRPPTITRLVRELERQGLVFREADREDRRVQWIRATPKGQRLLREGRARRVQVLAASVADLAPEEQKALARAVPVLERLTVPPSRPRPRERRGGVPRTATRSTAKQNRGPRPQS